MRDGHECVAYDVNADAVAAMEAEGATRRAHAAGARRRARTPPRHIWIMVPAAFVGVHHRRVRSRCCRRATRIIDGGNSWYRDDVDRAGAARGARASTTSTSAPAAACSASSAATA